MKFKLLSLLLIISITNLFSCSKSLNWQEYKSDDGKFSIQMPFNPEEKKDKSAGAHNMTIAEARTGSSLFIVSFADYPKKSVKRISAKRLLKAIKDAAMEQVKNKKDIRENEIKIDGNTAIKYSAVGYTSRFGETEIDYRNVLVGNRLYQISVMSKKGEVNKKDIEKFFSSFRLLKK